MPGWLRADRDGVMLSVRLTPKSNVERIDGARLLADGTEVLLARVRAAPEKGAANSALEKLVAKALGLAPGAVKVASGHTSRLKRVHVAADHLFVAEKLIGSDLKSKETEET